MRGLVGTFYIIDRCVCIHVCRDCRLRCVADLPIGKNIQLAWLVKSEVHESLKNMCGGLHGIRACDNAITKIPMASP